MHDAIHDLHDYNQLTCFLSRDSTFQKFSTYSTDLRVS